MSWRFFGGTAGRFLPVLGSGIDGPIRFLKGPGQRRFQDLEMGGDPDPIVFKTYLLPYRHRRIDTSALVKQVVPAANVAASGVHNAGLITSLREPDR